MLDVSHAWEEKIKLLSYEKAKVNGKKDWSENLKQF